ncbi:MAG: glycosyltransferase [Candidatus Competibacteraceae bacterium]|nr:glycosyltransferase [Candidatus Competibacteraceae bacterium]
MAASMTIVFATFNGEKTLPRMLEALCQVRPPQGGLQIIAVDNASSDKTPEILRYFLDHLPLVVLHQPERGKNRALNLAIPHIQGDIVIFTDDDVLPDQNWLNAYEQCAAVHPECDIFGGAIFPYWEIPPETWLLESIPLGGTFALTSPDLQEGQISPGLIWGPNMMVRKKIFDAGNFFNETVGPNKGQYVMGSETEFNYRICQQGSKTWFCPAARVQHIIRNFQMNEKWITNRAYRMGRGLCIAEYFKRDGMHKKPYFFGLCNFPRWMVRRVLQDTIACWFYNFTGNKSKSLMMQFDAAFYRGYIRQAQELKKVII